MARAGGAPRRREDTVQRRSIRARPRVGRGPGEARRARSSTVDARAAADDRWRDARCPAGRATRYGARIGICFCAPSRMTP